jgi:hypothetical protein
VSRTLVSLGASRVSQRSRVTDCAVRSATNVTSQQGQRFAARAKLLTPSNGHHDAMPFYQFYTQQPGHHRHPIHTRSTHTLLFVTVYRPTYYFQGKNRPAAPAALTSSADCVRTLASIFLARLVASNFSRPTTNDLSCRAPHYTTTGTTSSSSSRAYPATAAHIKSDFGKLVWYALH